MAGILPFGAVFIELFFILSVSIYLLCNIKKQTHRITNSHIFCYSTNLYFVHSTRYLVMKFLIFPTTLIKNRGDNGYFFCLQSLFSESPNRLFKSANLFNVEYFKLMPLGHLGKPVLLLVWFLVFGLPDSCQLCFPDFYSDDLLSVVH